MISPRRASVAMLNSVTFTLGMLIMGLGPAYAQGETKEQVNTQNPEQSEDTRNISETFRSASLIGRDVALDLDWNDALMFLDWRPRFIPLEDIPSEVDVYVGIDGLRLDPSVASDANSEGRRYISALAIDTGAEISALEVAAFIRAANRIVSAGLPAQEFSIGQFSDTLLSIGPLSAEPERLREELLDLQKDEISSQPIFTISILTQAIVNLPADRRAIYIFTDAQSCDESQPVPTETYVEFYQTSRTVVHTVLYAETEPTPRCIEALSTITEMTGGTIFTIDEEGKNQSQPLNTVTAFGSGAELAYDFSGLRVPPGQSTKQVDIVVVFNGAAFTTSVEVELPSMGWGEYLVILFRAYAAEIAAIAFLPALLFSAIIIRGRLKRPIPPKGWLDAVRGQQGPIILGKKRVVLADKTENGKTSKLVWLNSNNKGVTARTKTGATLNGVPFKSAILQHGDILEVGWGVQYRYHAFYRSNR